MSNNKESRKKESKQVKQEVLEEVEEVEELFDGGGASVEGQDPGAGPEEGSGQEPDQEDGQNTKYLRLMADFQNYKRRSEKEKSDIYSYANEKLINELLSVIDDFERALAHEPDASGNFVEGMFMILKNFRGILEKSGLTEIEALGADFDPNVHNAVMADAGSSYESGKVCDVIQKGYKLNNKVIRPSMVRVAE